MTVIDMMIEEGVSKLGDLVKEIFIPAKAEGPLVLDTDEIDLRLIIHLDENND